MENFYGNIFVTCDIVKIIFDGTDFWTVSEKKMRLVCKIWKDILDSNSYPGILGRIRESNIHRIRYDWSLQTWDHVSRYLKLKDWFIHQFRDKLNWKHIVEKQSLSQEFRDKHSKYINNIIHRKEIPNCVIRYI